MPTLPWLDFTYLAAASSVATESSVDMAISRTVWKVMKGSCPQTGTVEEFFRHSGYNSEVSDVV